MIDYYKLLGVPRAADEEAIRAAYRAQAKSSHPDAHPHLEGDAKAAMERRFIQLAQAYGVLGDPGQRRDYDRKWSAAARAEPAQRGPHAKTRPGASAKNRGGRTRSKTAAGAGPEKTSQPEDVSLEDLLREVESLLGRYGLGLRPPFEEALESLLAWARGLYAQVLDAFRDNDKGAPRPPASSKKSRTNAGSTRASAAKEPDSASTPPEKSTGTSTATEEELAAIKRRVRKGRAARSKDKSPIEQELEAIKRRVRRKK